MIKKIKKHSKILKVRGNSQKEEQRLTSVSNDLLNNVYNIIIGAKENKFTEKEKSHFTNCENHREKLLSSNEVISYEIFNSDRTAIVKDICKKAASSKSWCRLIYNLIAKTNSQVVFEVGTNLGISGTYILHALSDRSSRQFVTLEGLSQLCKIAGNAFEKIESKDNFTIWQGLYENTFDKAVDSIGKLDCGFIDGNHQYEPTLEYFAKLEPLIQEQGLLIFDDINWNNGMQKAWTEIKSSEKVTFSIDLHEIGIAIIDRNFKGTKESFSFHYDY